MTGQPVRQPAAGHAGETDQTQNSSIMVVDDQPANLKLLEDMLRQQDYFVRSFPRGRMALAAAVQHPPDLILTILEDASLLTEIEVGPEKFAPTPVALTSIVNRAIERTAAFSLSRQVAIGRVPSADGLILGVEDLMIRAIQALLETAVQFSTPGETVRVEHHFAPDAVRLLIESWGYTIPDTLLPKFFDLLAIGEAIIPGGDLGLAPPVAARILALFGGSVSVENHDSAGIRLTVSLKRAENPN